MSVVPQVLIGGLDVTATYAVSQVRHRARVNGVGSATFVVEHETGIYVPEEDAVVDLKEDGVTGWKGTVSGVNVAYLGYGGTSVSVDAQDINLAATRQVVNHTFATDSLSAVLSALITAGDLTTQFSVSLDPAQETGPTVTGFEAAWWTVDDVLKHLADVTGWVWHIGPTGLLRLWDPTSRASGVTISVANGNLIDATWSRHRFAYRNRQWVLYGPNEIRNVTQDWTGDGVVRIFPLSSTPNATPYWVMLNPLPDPADWVKPVGIYGVDAMEWTFDAATGAHGSLRQDAGYPVLESSDVLRTEYPVQFPQAVKYEDLAEIGTRGLWAKVESREDVVDVAAALAYAESLVRKNKTSIKMPTIRTIASVPAGHTAVVSLPEIGLDVTCFAESVERSWEQEEDEVRVESSLTLWGGSEAQASTDEIWRELLGTGNRAAGGSAVGGGGSSGGGGIVTSGRRYADLGGDLGRESAPAAGTWTPVPGTKPVLLYAADFPGGIATVHVWPITRNAATSVRLRIVAWNGSTWVQVGGPSAYSTQTDHLVATARQSFTVDVLDGALHLLQMERDNTTANITGRGYVE